MPDIYLDTDTFNKANADVWERGTNTALADNWEANVTARAPAMAADAQERADAAERKRQADQWAADAAAKAAAIMPPAPAPAPPVDVAPTVQADTSAAPAPAPSVPGVPAPAPSAPAPVTPTSPVTAPISDPTSTRQPLPGPQPVTETTAGLSGGGASAGKITPQGHQILAGSADIASWLGGEGQKALQAVLVTEGGLNGARGDQGRSAGPLQFYEGGQLANFARQHGMSLDQAKNYVEQNPLEAIRWAVGTQDAPGYLGSAILAGQKAGLSGSDLATYAQRHGQVSVSPERAGQNYNALFGNGENPVQAAASGAMRMVNTAVQTVIKDLRPSQFGVGLSDAEAYAACGPVAAMAFSRAMGRNPSAQEAVTLARQFGWTPAQGMAGPGSELSLLKAMGVPAHMEQGADPNKIIADIQNGNPVMISTPGHYFVVDGYNPQTGQFHAGTSGTDLKAGAEWMSLDRMQQVMGTAQATLFMDRQPGDGPSVAVQHQARQGSPSDSTTYMGTNQPADPSKPRAPALEDPLDPIKHIGDTISDAITTGLRSIFGSTTTPAPEGGGYGAVPAGGTNPLMPPDILGGVKSAADVVGGALPDITGRIGHLDPNSPIAQQAAGNTTNPFDVKNQAVSGLADVIMPGEGPLPVVKGVIEGVLDPANLPGGVATSLAELGIDGLRAVAAPLVARYGPIVVENAIKRIDSALGEPAAAFASTRPSPGDLTGAAGDLAGAASGAVDNAAQTASGIFLPGRGAGAQAGTDILGPAGQVVGKVQDLADQLHPRIQELFGEHPEYADIAQQGLNDLVDSGANPTQLGRYFAGLERNAGVNQPKVSIGGIGAEDWFRALRNGAMAGGLSTLGHVFLNIPIQSVMSLPREAVASVFRGAPEQIPAAAVGLFKGYSAGWEAAAQQLRYGLSAAEGATGELPFGTTALRATNPIAESAYNALQGLVTTHGVAQTFMENVGFIQKLTQQAWTMAKDEGLAGQAFTQRVEEIVNNAAIDPKLADILGTAQQYGKRMALRGEQGTLGRGAQKVASAGPAGNLLIPFESIAYNVLSRGLEMTPAGVAGTGLDVARKAIGTGPYAAGASEAGAAAVAPISERLANNVIGLGLLGFGLDMAMHGRVVGHGPDNPTERRQWLDQGGQPDSLVFGGQENDQGQIVGGRSVSGHLLGSAFYPFATAASIVEAHRANPDAPVQDQMLDAVRRTGEYVTNETWLRSVAQLTDALKTEGSAGQKAQSYLANLTESFVPQTALLRNVEQATDPSVRQAPKGDFLGRLATAYPGFAGQEPPKLNLMGNSVSNPNEGVGIFAPTGRGQVEPVEQALGQASMALTSPPTHVQINDTYSTDITPDEQRTWEQARGQRLSQVVGRLIENPGFSALPMDRRRELLQRAIDSADEIANRTVLKTIPHDELVQRAKAYQQHAVRQPFASTAAP